ncbi:hypothetical protein ACFX12_045497 [Malus domestica]
MVEIEREVALETEHVMNGLPRTRKKLRLEEGKSNVTLRSLKEEILWGRGESGFWVAEMARSAVKIWCVKAEVEERDG